MELTELAEPTTIKAPIGQLQTKNTLYFYESGALKSCILANDEEIETDIGKIKIGYDSTITFYESGSLKEIFDCKYSVLKTALGQIECCPKTFYNSGNSKIFQLRTYSHKEINYEYECDLGKFMIADDRIATQYPSGNIKSFIPKDSYDIKTPIGDTFGMGGNEEDYRIYFRDDGSLICFITDDVIKVEIAGVKVTIPAGTYLSFYANSNICDFTASNETSFTIGKQKIDFNGNSTFRASEDGKKIIECPYFTVYQKDTQYPLRLISNSSNVKELYDNGIPKKIIGGGHIYYLDDAVKYFIDIHTDDSSATVIVSHLKNEDFRTTLIADSASDTYYYLQDGDINRNVGMVYFADSGLPSSYALYKYDDFGDILLDDVNKPIIDSENKKKFKN